jgi:hypothetical protein
MAGSARDAAARARIVFFIVQPFRFADLVAE